MKNSSSLAYWTFPFMFFFAELLFFFVVLIPFFFITEGLIFREIRYPSSVCDTEDLMHLVTTWFFLQGVIITMFSYLHRAAKNEPTKTKQAKIILFFLWGTLCIVNGCLFVGSSSWFAFSLFCNICYWTPFYMLLNYIKGNQQRAKKVNLWLSPSMIYILHTILGGALLFAMARVESASTGMTNWAICARVTFFLAPYLICMVVTLVLIYLMIWNKMRKDSLIIRLILSVFIGVILTLIIEHYLMSPFECQKGLIDGWQIIPCMVLFMFPQIALIRNINNS